MHTKETKTPQALRGLALGVALLGLAGCFPPSALEMDYGNSVRNNIAQQVVNPRAGFNPKPAVGLPPQAAANEMERYDKTFKEEPKKMGKQLETDQMTTINEPHSPHHQGDRGGPESRHRGRTTWLMGESKNRAQPWGLGLTAPAVGADPGPGRDCLVLPVAGPLADMWWPVWRCWPFGGPGLWEWLAAPARGRAMAG